MRFSFSAVFYGLAALVVVNALPAEHLKRADDRPEVDNPHCLYVGVILISTTDLYSSIR